jgi:hypothetical protein
LSSKHRAFTFRYLHRTLVFTKLLYKIEKIDSKLCSFCGESEETFTHLYMYCRVTENCYRELSQWLLTGDVTLTREQAILDYYCDSAIELFRQKIVTIFRHFLYSCRCKRELPNLNRLLYYVKCTQDVEENIAKRRDKLAVHLRASVRTDAFAIYQTVFRHCRKSY